MPCTQNAMEKQCVRRGGVGLDANVGLVHVDT
jgi:hypothetical protein